MSICPCIFRNYYASNPNNARSKRRAVLYMAMSYYLISALTWIPTYLFFFGISNNATGIINGILPPLQGLYNLIVVYMSPNVRNARNKKRGKLP